MKRAVAFITALIMIYTAGTAFADGGYRMGQSVTCTASILDNITLIDETKTTENEEYETTMVTDTNVSDGKSTFIGVDVENVPIELYSSTDIEMIAANNDTGVVEFIQHAKIGINTDQINPDDWFGKTETAELVERILTEESQTSKDLRESQENASEDIIENATSGMDTDYVGAMTGEDIDIREMEEVDGLSVRDFKEEVPPPAPSKLDEAAETVNLLNNLFNSEDGVGGYFQRDAIIVSRPDLYDENYGNRYVDQTIAIEVGTSTTTGSTGDDRFPHQKPSDIVGTIEINNATAYSGHIGNVQTSVEKSDMSREEVERIFVEECPEIDMEIVTPMLDIVYSSEGTTEDTLANLKSAGYDIAPYVGEDTMLQVNEDGSLENNSARKGIITKIFALGIANQYNIGTESQDGHIINITGNTNPFIIDASGAASNPDYSYTKIQVPYTKENRDTMDSLNAELEELNYEHDADGKRLVYREPSLGEVQGVITKYQEDLVLTPEDIEIMSNNFINSRRKAYVGTDAEGHAIYEDKDALEIETNITKSKGLTVGEGMYMPLELETALYFVMGAQPPEYELADVERKFNGGPEHAGAMGGGGTFTTKEFVLTSGQSKEEVMDEFVEGYLWDKDGVEFYTIGELKKAHPEIKDKVNGEMYGDFDADKGFLSVKDWFLGSFLQTGERTVKMTNEVTGQEEEANISNTELDKFYMGTYGYVTISYNGETYYVKTEDLDAAINKAAEDHDTTDYFNKNYLVINDDGKISTAIEFDMGAFLLEQIMVVLSDPFYAGEISLQDLIDEYIDPSDAWGDVILDIAEATGEDVETVQQYWQETLEGVINEVVERENDPAVTAAWEEVKAGNTSFDISTTENSENSETTFEENEFVKWLEEHGLLDESDMGKQPGEISKESMEGYYSRYFDRYLTENSGLMIFDMERRIIKSAKATTERETTNYKHMSYQWTLNGGSPTNGGQTRTLTLGAGETTVHAVETYQMEQESVMCYDYYEVWYIDAGSGVLFPIYYKEVTGGFAGLGGNTTDRNVISMSKTFGKVMERDAGSWSFTVDQDEYGQPLGEDISMGGSIIRTSTFVDGGYGYWINGVQMYTYPEGYVTPVEETKSYRIE